MAKRDVKPVEDDAARRRFVALPLAQLVPGLTRAAFKKRSPAGASLMADWASVVGAELASRTEPRKLSRGQLTVACAGPVAMELQHVAAALIERINTHAGEKLVERLRFTQDYVAPVAGVKRRRRVAVETVEELPEGELNVALARLRAAIRGR
jgi:hypothetical protein